MESFIKMIATNDVTEADLANHDNKLYQKLIDRSKTVLPGDDLNSPIALYRYETMTSKMMKKNSVIMGGIGKSSFAGRDKSITMDNDAPYFDGKSIET